MPRLNRRNFLQSIGAALAAPLIPALPAAAAPTATHTPLQMLWATYYAQMNNACSPAQITRALNVSPQVAQSIYQGLLARGVIKAPLAGGVARARHPMADGMNGHRPKVRTSPEPTTKRRVRIDLDALMEQITRDIARQIPFRTAIA